MKRDKKKHPYTKDNLQESDFMQLITSNGTWLNMARLADTNLIVET